MKMDKVVPVEANEHNSEFCKIRENFAFRFGYNSPQENLLAFKNRTFSAIARVVDDNENMIRFIARKVCKIVANDSYYPEENCVQQNFVIEVAEALKVSGINAVLCQVGTEYKFYPASEKFLDEKLVIDVLNFF